MTYGMGGWIVCNFRVAGNGHIMNFLWDIIHLWNCMELLKPLSLLNVTYIVGELLEGRRQIFPEQRETQSGRTEFMPILRDGYNPFFDSNPERSCLVEVKQLELHARRSPLHFRVQWLGMCSAVFLGGQNFTTWP
ncbi:unnamed protein product [Sphagnum jensenii]|uniref:Uncharacterized protein n=1 Tax=Sphagnum jensenii TaxID=128206 RepID=A0ABP0WSD2_9BRYO